MNRKKPTITHNPKKMGFSRKNSVNSSILNLSINYKRQIFSLRENNRSLARRLNFARQRLKAAENIITEMRKTCHQQALKVISGNLNRMAAQLRPFLDTLEQSIHFCAYPDDVDVDTTILNPEIDVRTTPPHEILSASGQSESLPRRTAPGHRTNLDVFPMTPILEQSSRETSERVDLVDSASGRKSTGRRVSRVTRRTKSKGCSSGTNTEVASPAVVENISAVNNLVPSVSEELKLDQPTVGRFVHMDRLPSILTGVDKATPEIYRFRKPPVTNRVAVQMPFTSERKRDLSPTVPNLDVVRIEDDENVTVKIPVDMELTMLNQASSSSNACIEVLKPQLKDTTVIADTIPLVALNGPSTSGVSKKTDGVTIDGDSKAIGIGKVLITKKPTNQDKLQPSKCDFQKVPDKCSINLNSVTKSSRIPKLVTKEQVASPQSQRSSEQGPSSNLKDTSESLPVTVHLEYTQSQSMSRVPLTPLRNVGNDDTHLNKSSPGAKSSSPSRKSVCPPDPVESPKSPDMFARRTKLVAPIFDSDSSSNSEDSDYCPVASQTDNRNTKPKPKRGSENFRFFSTKRYNRVNESKPRKRRRIVASSNTTPTENALPSVYDLTFKDSNPSSEAQTVTTKKSKKPSLAENKLASTQSEDSERAVTSKESEPASAISKDETEVLPPRRTKAVSYKEPSLNKKMRREK